MATTNSAVYNQCSTEEYKVETEQPKRRCRPWLLILIGVAIVIIIVVIALAIVFTQRPSKSSELEIERISALCSIRITNREFTSELNQTSSDEFAELESLFIDTMHHVFNQSSLASTYDSTNVVEFRPGSVVVFFRLILVDPPPALTAHPLTNSNREKTKEHVRNLIRKAITSGVSDASSVAGIELEADSLLIHEVILHLSDDGDDDEVECIVPTGEEYIYLSEGEVRTVTSPCYPEAAEVPDSYTQILVAPEGHRIIISFSEFRYAMQTDYLYFGSATEPDVVGTFIDRYTGYDFPPDMITSGPGLWMRGWTQNFAQVVTGVYEATVTVVKDDDAVLNCTGDSSPCRYALKCYTEEDQCDGTYQCPSGTDEIGCECYPPLLFYKCSDGKCMPRQYICNGPQGCSDDEAFCNFTCENGNNVTERYICDGFNDCGDYSDEKQNCSCDAKIQWQCPDGTCVFQNNICDGFPQCPGGEDEENCNCLSWQFECTDSSCIPFWERCDGNNTCGDNSDEQNCLECPGKFYRCASSFQCLKSEALCNGEDDCYGGEDEKDCPSPEPCKEGEFTCSDGQCLRPSLVCDGVPQCINGTDEIDNCSDASCDFRCYNGECIPDEWVCDGMDDCGEGEDEPDCDFDNDAGDEDCEDGLFRCPGRQCISQDLVCNGVRDCKGNHDEINCTGSIPDPCGTMTDQDYFVCDGKDDCPMGEDEQNCQACGKTPGKDRRRRELGGREATSMDWPWQIYLTKGENSTDKPSCGGSILNRRWVITAAHCISTYEIGRYVVLAGVTNRFDVHSVPVEIVDVYEHPNFTFNGFYLLHDAALIQLGEPLQFNVDTQPICLPDVDIVLEGGEYLISTGFGETGAGSLSSQLMETRLPIIPSEVCIRWTEHDLEAVSKVICVGYETGVQGPCYGDSGGPLVIERDGSWYLVGIVSGGAQCGAPYTPNFYTRVTILLDWIDDVIKLR